MKVKFITMMALIFFSAFMKPSFAQHDDIGIQEVHVNVSPADVHCVDYINPVLKVNRQESPKAQFVYFQTDDPPEEKRTLWEIIKENWWALILGLIGFIEVIVTITPTEKDNTWLKWLKNIVQGIIPNKKSGGGKHET